MMGTLTRDRGKEVAAHKKFTVATDVAVYFPAIRRVPGSAERARTPTGYSDDTCPAEPISPCTVSTTWTRSR